MRLVLMLFLGLLLAERVTRPSRMPLTLLLAGDSIATGMASFGEAGPSRRQIVRAFGRVDVRVAAWPGRPMKEVLSRFEHDVPRTLPAPLSGQPSSTWTSAAPLIVAGLALFGTIVNSALVFYGGQMQSRGVFDAEMVKVGIQILAADPAKSDVSPARQWAINLVEKHSGQDFDVADRESLLHHSINSTVFLPNPNLPGGLANAGCDAWHRNSDGSYTQTGTIKTPANSTLLGNTLKNTPETRWLDEHCR